MSKNNDLRSHHDVHSLPRFGTTFLDHYGQVFCVRFSSLPFFPAVR